jgi:hypothetical protein
MRIEYELKLRDYLLFNAVHQFLSVPTQLVFGLFAAFIFYLTQTAESQMASAILALGSYVVMWIGQFLFNIVFLSVGKNRSLLTRHVVEIKDDALYEETKFNSSCHYWKGLVKVVNRPGFVAVYISAHAAHIIPHRAFSSVGHRKDFVAALNEKLSVV